MANRVHLLPEDLANKIAAGEVVERPASVVKELLENAIDAQAQSIHIDIQQGGLKQIEVIDDGWGMSREDALLCLERHATSKLRTAEDLFRINTLGFRGEALPSIASVSRFTLLTRQADDLAATKISVQGTEKLVEEMGAPQGTRITVNELFYNTPARLKFMKSTVTEASHVAETVTRLAIAHPEVAITLVQDDRMQLSTPGNNDLWDVLLTLYGKETAKGLVPVSFVTPALSIQGYVGLPSAARSNRLHEHVVVNGRYVRCRTLQHAIEEAYRHTMPARRYPLVAITIQIAPEMVDVNVHPAKTEVRFRHDGEVHQAVLKAIRQSLGQPGVGHTHGYEEAAIISPMPQVVKEEEVVQVPLFGEAAVRTPPAPPRTSSYEPINRQAAGGTAPQAVFDLVAVQPPSARSVSVAPNLPNAFPPVRVIAQLSGTYILAQAVDSWLILDQHAAHERILYEEFKQAMIGGAIATQLMMVPLTIELTSFELARLSARMAELEKLGFVMEPFGEDTLMVRGVPQLLGEGAGREALLELLDQVIHSPKAPAAHELVDGALITLSCKGAVKANQWLPMAKQEEIIMRLGVTPDYATCPHGRPTHWWLTLAELEKRFQRS